LSSLGKQAKSSPRRPTKAKKVGSVRPPVQTQTEKGRESQESGEGQESRVRPEPGHGVERGRREALDPLRAAQAEAPQVGAISQLLNIGYGNLVIASRVVAIVSPQSSPMRRLREDAIERGKLVDATHGRRTRSILVTDSDHVILSAINPETIALRLTPDESEAGS
jgi:regulator of extracellular matrix RemA (YlzA/DUF370 family)